MKTLIGIQEEYIGTVNAGIARWSHRKGIQGVGTGVGGHADRIARGAHRKAEKQLRQLGFEPKQIAEIIGQAREMALLERLAE